MSDKKEEPKAEESKEEKKEESKGDDKPKGGGGGGSGGADAAKFRTVLDTRNRVDKIVLNSEDDKFDLERIRRWKVQINEIYIT